MTDLLLAGPSVEPISRTEAKLHLRETNTGQDALIDTIITSARRYVETYTRRALVMQARRAILDCFPPQIELPAAPLRAVESIKYLDTAGTLQTLAASSYRVDKTSARPKIVPEYGVTWPSTYMVPNAVTVDYFAGHLAPFTANGGTDIFTAANHGYADADKVELRAIGGTLPAGVVARTMYHVRDVVGDTFKLAASAGGAAVDITDNGTPPMAVGVIPDELLHGLKIVAQYYEQRDGDPKLLEQANRVLQPLRVVRF